MFNHSRTVIKTRKVILTTESNLQQNQNNSHIQSENHPQCNFTTVIMIYNHFITIGI